MSNSAGICWRSSAMRPDVSECKHPHLHQAQRARPRSVCALTTDTKRVCGGRGATAIISRIEHCVGTRTFAARSSESVLVAVLSSPSTLLLPRLRICNPTVRWPAMREPAWVSCVSRVSAIGRVSVPDGGGGAVANVCVVPDAVVVPLAVVVVHCFGVVTSLDKTRRTQITRRWCGDATVRCGGANDVAITSQTQKATPKLCKYAHVTHGEHRTQRLGGGDPHPTNEGRQTSRSTCASTRSTSAWCCTRSTSACTRSTGACGLVGTPNKQPADRRVRSCELVRASP